MSEASIPKMKLLVARLANKMIKTTVKSSDDGQSSDDQSTDCETESKSNKILQKDCENLKRVYVNPMIAELKQTKVKFVTL